jgi:hypothetical protein
MAENKLYNFNLPSPYQSELSRIADQQRMAQMLQAQSQAPTERFSYKGIEAHTPATAGLAKLLQGLAGGYFQNEARDQEKALGERYKTESSDILRKAFEAGAGTPAVAGQAAPREEILQPTEEAGGGPGRPADPTYTTPGRAAVAPNPQEMARLLMTSPNPAHEAFGLQQMQKNAQMRAFINAGNAGNAPAPSTAPVATAGGAMPTGGAPGAAPSNPPMAAATSKFGGPAGGQPMAVWMQLDPTGAKYTEQLAKDNIDLAKLGMDKKKLDQTIAEFRGMNAYQKTQAIQALDTRIIKLFEMKQNNMPVDDMLRQAQNERSALAAQQGAQAPQAPQGMPQPGMQPQAPQQPPGMQIPPQVQQQRDAEADAIKQREATGGGIPTANVIPGSTVGLPQGGHKPIPIPPGLGPAQSREYTAKMETSRPHDLNSLENGVASIDQAIEQAKSVLKHPGLKMATGRTAYMATSPFLSQSAYDAKQKLETLSGQILLSVLSTLKQVSPNGSSGFGALNKSEGDAIRNSIASLENAQSYEQVMEAVQTVQNNLTSSRDRLTRGFERLYGEAPQIKSYTNIPKSDGVSGLSTAEQSELQELRKRFGQ